MQTTRLLFNYFKRTFSILSVKRCISVTSLQYTSNLDVIDAFTNDLILKHKARLNDTNDPKDMSFNYSELINKELHDMTEDELSSLFLQLLSKNNDKHIEQLLINCTSTRTFIDKGIVKNLFRHYSLSGKPEMVVALQKYCSKVDINLYRRNAEFMHDLAKAQCMKGNSEKGLSVLKYCYINFPNRRSLYRLIFRDLIQDSVLHRSEATLVIFKKFVQEFSDILEDHYPLVCFWHICWSSSWFSDQILAEELLESSKSLQNIVKDKATAFSLTVLKDYNEDAVMRLLQTLLKYAMLDEYAKVLQVLFTYKLRNRDIRGCAEIIKNCEVLGISLPSDQQGQYIRMLITGHKSNKPEAHKSTLKNFKLKF